MRIEMPKLNPNLFLDEDYEVYADRRQHRKTKHKPNHQPKRSAGEVVSEIAEAGGRESFEFTYKASRHEREWINNSLGNFYDEHWLDDVIRLLKGGKEASVYLCMGNETTQASHLAAKVYRPRMFRQLRKDHQYREGRTDLDASGNQITEDGMLQAMRSKSKYGLELLHTSWIEYEYQALADLHVAGGNVPRPYARGHNAILMEYIGDLNQTAPLLVDVQLEASEAQRLFDRLLCNIEIMLSQEWVHGDLSAYNILYWDGGITLIDFPQVVSPQGNSSAYQIFERDVLRVCEYFARQAVVVRPHQLAADLWTSCGYRLSPEVHPRLLDEEDQADRAYWQQIQG
jgi:RIO kinase 1